MDNKQPSRIKINASGDFTPAIDKAADILLAGGVVAFSTETFYGLAVDVRNEAAIKRLFAIKNRPAGRPVLMLIAGVELLDHYVAAIPPTSLRLINEFWPGGLTLVFKAGPRVSPLLTGGTQKIGIRFSSHPVATALARAIGAPISGTSANKSDQPSCRNAQEVVDSCGKGIDLILDAGETPGKAASTVLDVTSSPPKILREGIISREQLGLGDCPRMPFCPNSSL